MLTYNKKKRQKTSFQNKNIQTNLKPTGVYKKKKKKKKKTILKYEYKL